VAVSAIKMTQRNLAGRAARFPLAGPAGRHRPAAVRPIGDSSGAPRPSPRWLNPASTPPLMLIHHLCHVGAGISYFQMMTFPAFVRGALALLPELSQFGDECLRIYGYCTPVPRSAAVSIFPGAICPAETQP